MGEEIILERKPIQGFSEPLLWSAEEGLVSKELRSKVFFFPLSSAPRPASTSCHLLTNQNCDFINNKDRDYNQRGWLHLSLTPAVPWTTLSEQFVLVPLSGTQDMCLNQRFLHLQHWAEEELGDCLQLGSRLSYLGSTPMIETLKLCINKRL